MACDLTQSHGQMSAQSTFARSLRKLYPAVQSSDLGDASPYGESALTDLMHLNGWGSINTDLAEGLRSRFIADWERWDVCGVRRQSFWDRRWPKLRESLAPLVCNIMRLADGAASGGWRWFVVLSFPFRSEWSGPIFHPSPASSFPPSSYNQKELRQRTQRKVHFQHPVWP